MSQRSWTGLAFYVAAGHDGPAMTNLRDLAHGVEAQTNDQAQHNGNLGKKRVLALAMQKCREGNFPPRTSAEVNERGQTFGHAENPLGIQKKRRTDQESASAW